MVCAYKDAFGNYLGDIIDNRAIDALATVRNNLVHRGGIIDEKYLRRKNSLPPNAVGDIGSLIQLDGELSTALINPVATLGNDLIIAVDKWLSEH